MTDYPELARRWKGHKSIPSDEVFATLDTLTAENARYKALLQEARAQIEYLHGKFSETGSGNAVLARIDTALQETQNG